MLLSCSENYWFEKSINQSSFFQCEHFHTCFIWPSFQNKYLISCQVLCFYTLYASLRYSINSSLCYLFNCEFQKRRITLELSWRFWHTLSEWGTVKCLLDVYQWNHLFFTAWSLNQDEKSNILTVCLACLSCFLIWEFG